MARATIKPTMSLQNQLIEDMKQAMKSGDRVRLDAIRFLRSEIKNYEIDHGDQDDAGVETLIAKQTKQMRESIEEYKKGGRQDLADDEQAKLTILEKYLPEQMSDEELQVIVNEVLAHTPTPQMGPVIGQVMSRVKGKADGGRVSALVKAALQ
jgi:uncharacterized protein